MKEKYWIDHPASLFEQLSPIPEGDITSPARVNALTRAVLLTSALLYYNRFPLWKQFLMFGIVLVFVLYRCGKRKTKAAEEHFAFLSQSSSKEMSQSTMNPNPNLITPASIQRENDIKSMLSQKSIKDNYRGNIDQWTAVAAEEANPKIVQEGCGYYHPRLLPGKRDQSSDIQYFSVDQGVNRRTMIEPIIGPRILDQDVWGKSSTVFPGINDTTYVDMTTNELGIDEIAGLNPLSRTLARPVMYEQQDPNAVWQSNRPGQDPDIGFYNWGNFLYGDRDVDQFDEEILPIYKNKNNSWGKTFSPPNTNMEVDQVYPSLYKGTYATYKDKAQPAKDTKKEGFAFVSPTQTAVADFIDSPLQDTFYTQPDVRRTDAQVYDKMNRVPPGVDVQDRQGLPEQLYPQSPTYVYTDDFFKRPNARLFMQDVQPKMYSYSVDQTPINASVGVSYMPQRPPRTVDQVVDSNNRMSFPLYNRIDPQLVRDQGTKGQLAMNASRSPYTAKYSNFEAPAGTINFEDIYDPRFNSYGDPYRSYSDINLGQVQYYYSDVDAYRQPNFITRSNVDFIDYRDPMGRIKPYYNRTASVDDVRASVENQYEADQLFFRQDMMESLMAKRNSEEWQLREAPLRRTANSNMPYGPT